MSQLILLVDPNPGILRYLRVELSRAGYRVISSSKGAEALRKAEEQRPDLVVLDILLDDIDGMEALRTLCSRSIPVMVLTADSKLADKVAALRTGAEDYITKPFDIEEMIARVKAVLRRSAPGVAAHQSTLVALGDVAVDLEGQCLIRGEQKIELTRKEWQLLALLVSNLGRAMLSTELLASVWGPEYVNDVQYLRVLVARLRRKMGDDPSHPSYLVTIPGVGYRLRQVYSAPAA